MKLLNEVRLFVLIVGSCVVCMGVISSVICGLVSAYYYIFLGMIVFDWHDIYRFIKAGALGGGGIGGVGLWLMYRFKIGQR